MAPLAGVLKPLSGVATITQQVFSGTQPEEMAEQYRNKYWQADDLVLKALAYPLAPAQQVLVQKLLALIYTPWLDEVTRNFQELVKAKGYPGVGQVNEATADYAAAGEVVFFVGKNGLRYDLAQRLLLQLQSLGDVKFATNWGSSTISDCHGESCCYTSA